MSVFTDIKDLAVSSFWSVINFFSVFFGVIFVADLSNLPSPDNRNIKLSDNKTYIICTNVDLEGNYITSYRNTTIIGWSSENCSLTSELQSGESLITSEWSLPLRHIALSVSGTNTKILNLDASGNANQALDWYGVNFTGGTIGRIANYTNFICVSSAFISLPDGFTFGGTMGTVKILNSSLTGLSSTGGYYVQYETDAVISRRFKLNDCAVFVPASNAAVFIPNTVTVGTENIIIESCNFSGTGDYIDPSGFTYQDNETYFFDNKGTGFNNTAITGYYYMSGNSTATTISDTTNYFKFAGTTTFDTDSEKFDGSTSNRLVYNGAIPRRMEVKATASLTSSNNQDLSVAFYFYDSSAASGSIITATANSETTDGNGKLSNFPCFGMITFDTGDYIELHGKNATSTTDITLVQCGVSAIPVGGN